MTTMTTTVKGHLGSISFDGQTVTIEKKMRGQVRVPVSAITGVSIERAGVGYRGFRIAAAGGSIATNGKALGSFKDVSEDPYALPFRKKNLPQFQQLQAEIEQARIGSAT